MRIFPRKKQNYCKKSEHFEGRVQFCISPFINYEIQTNRELEQRIFKRPFTSFQTTTRSLRINEIYGRSCTSVRSSSEPLAEVQRALLVVLVLHAPHPEAGGLLGLRKLREHSENSEKGGEAEKRKRLKGKL